MRTINKFNMQSIPILQKNVFNKYYTYFNGVNQYITLSNIISLRGNSTIIFCANITDNGGYEGILSDLYNSGNYARVQYRVNFLSIYAKDNSYKSFSFTPDGKWHLFAFLIDGSSGDVAFYLDNVLQTTRTVTSTDYDFKYIGSLAGNYFYKGGLDEPIFINRKISLSKLSDLYGNQTGDFDPTKMGNPKKLGTLEGWLRFGDKAIWNGTIWTFPDLSGNGYNGISNNMLQTNVRRH